MQQLHNVMNKGNIPKFYLLNGWCNTKENVNIQNVVPC